eukprot:UN00825
MKTIRSHLPEIINDIKRKLDETRAFLKELGDRPCVTRDEKIQTGMRLIGDFKNRYDSIP